MPDTIEAGMRRLKLGGLAKDWRSIPFENTEQYAAALLDLEQKEREVNRINRMVHTAGFNVLKTLEDFEWTNWPKGRGGKESGPLALLTGSERRKRSLLSIPPIFQQDSASNRCLFDCTSLNWIFRPLPPGASGNRRRYAFGCTSVATAFSPAFFAGLP